MEKMDANPDMLPLPLHNGPIMRMMFLECIYDTERHLPSDICLPSCCVRFPGFRHDAPGVQQLQERAAQRFLEFLVCIMKHIACIFRFVF